MIKNGQVKCLCTLVIIATFFLLGACGTTTNYQRLTVTDLHNAIIRYRTTAKDIKKSYGKPYKITKGISKVEKVYESINDTEGVNDNLSDQNYWNTIKESSNSEINPDAPYEVCYEYRGKELGVRAVYFFITDDKVMTYLFDGDITNKSVAQKDKYLRQILDYSRWLCCLSSELSSFIFRQSSPSISLSERKLAIVINTKGIQRITRNILSSTGKTLNMLLRVIRRASTLSLSSIEICD